MILAAFAAVVLLLALLALFDELRDGGSLSLFNVSPDDSVTGQLLEFPRGPGWTDDDVLRTYAEIEAL